MQVTPQNPQKQETATKLKEAEIYYSQGLAEEALEAYKAILSSGFPLNGEQREMIQGRLRELEGITGEGGRDSKDAIELAEDVVLTTDGQTSEGNVQAILDGAFALRELGLYDEAINEYVKLFNLDYPAEKIVPEICKCLLRSSPPAKVKEDVSRIIDEYAGGEQAKAMGKFRLGLEMEKINRPQYAMELYEEASALVPEDERIRERIDYLTKKHIPKKEKARKAIAQKVPEVKERRKWERINARIPEFVFVEFEMITSDGKPVPFRLQVDNYSKYGLGLLVPDDQKHLIHMIKPGDKLRDVTFFARWAVIRVDAFVRHVTELDSGPHKGQYIIGVESDEIIESSVGL